MYYDKRLDKFCDKNYLWNHINHILVSSVSTVLHAGQFYAFLTSAVFPFFKINFLKKCFRNTIRVSNNLYSDQARQFVGSDLGQNCQKMILASTELTDRKNRKKITLSLTELHHFLTFT